jgi:hypothetical protein
MKYNLEIVKLLLSLNPTDQEHYLVRHFYNRGINSHQELLRP